MDSSVNFAKFLKTPFFTEHFRWLLYRQLSKSDVRRARRFVVFRFIDDLIASNDGEKSEKSCKEIYMPELELKKRNRLF